jgi:hypothetical protein
MKDTKGVLQIDLGETAEGPTEPKEVPKLNRATRRKLQKLYKARSTKSEQPRYTTETFKFPLQDTQSPLTPFGRAKRNQAKRKRKLGN